LYLLITSAANQNSAPPTADSSSRLGVLVAKKFSVNLGNLWLKKVRVNPMNQIRVKGCLFGRLNNKVRRNSCLVNLFWQTPAEKPKVIGVDFVDDDKTFDKARFTRKICQVHVVGQNLCDLCGKKTLCVTSEISVKKICVTCVICG